MKGSVLAFYIADQWTGFGVLYQVTEVMRQGWVKRYCGCTWKDGHRLSSTAHPWIQGQGMHLVQAQRVRAKLGHDSQHQWQTVKHYKGKDNVVEMLQ